ncbi:unnamed protein product [Polarella glacialis]|uniref:Transmembrane protein n=1 Tax=Polarella glacialis TaxID=89957 RepID=A0A813G334_POLGL|nr:unnamed protein product [Polarella glacialis]
MELFDLRGVRLGVVRVLCSCSFFFLVVCFVAFLVCVGLFVFVPVLLVFFRRFSLILSALEVFFLSPFLCFIYWFPHSSFPFPVPEILDFCFSIWDRWNPFFLRFF